MNLTKKGLIEKFDIAMKHSFQQFVKNTLKVTEENEIQSSEQLDEKDDTRGDTEIQDARQNFQFLFGCPPANGVRTDTQMVYDIGEIFMNKIDLQATSLILPQALEESKGSDANFEVAQSNAIVPIRLIYQHNIIQKSRAIILFQNTPFPEHAKERKDYQGKTR